ncbi:MAG TPA: hypothetical protein VHW96_00290 [Solirubrobacteraceae bacterium]|nr:hypothetical protein [Solirubrobacteraceae bacterium]
MGVAARENGQSEQADPAVRGQGAATTGPLGPTRELQRAVGNAAFTRLIFGRDRAPRSLSRCGANCECAGCAQHRSGTDEVAERLRGAVAARRAAGPLALNRCGSERTLQRDLRAKDPPQQTPPDSGPSPTPDAGADGGQTAAEDAPTPDNPSLEQDPSKPIGVCGPDVSTPFSATLSKIQADFKSWSVDDQYRACDHLVHPIQIFNPDGTFNKSPTPDINGWDIHALFQGEATWLRRLPVCPPCATPSTNGPTKPPMDRAHEDPRTCSNTVQVGNSCWLSGTPNYASFGIMLRLCGDAFPSTATPPTGQSAPHEVFFGDDPLDSGKSLIRAYKLLHVDKAVGREDPKWPLAWTEAAYKTGPTATLAGGNRGACTATCTKAKPGLNPAQLANWDYVWEPVHPR